MDDSETKDEKVGENNDVLDVDSLDSFPSLPTTGSQKSADDVEKENKQKNTCIKMSVSVAKDVMTQISKLEDDLENVQMEKAIVQAVHTSEVESGGDASDLSTVSGGSDSANKIYLTLVRREPRSFTVRSTK